jgi:hypothetical protein
MSKTEYDQLIKRIDTALPTWEAVIDKLDPAKILCRSEAPGDAARSITSGVPRSSERSGGAETNLLGARRIVLGYWTEQPPRKRHVRGDSTK